MDNKLFLFNEASQIMFQLQLFHKGVKGRYSVFYDATIKLEANVMTLCIDVSEGSKMKELSNILIKTYKKKDYKLRNASIDGKEIELKIDNELKFTRYHLEKGLHQCSMTLKKISYSYKVVERLSIYRLNSTASTLLSSYLTAPIDMGNHVVGAKPTTYEGACYGISFTMFRDEHHVYIQTEGNIDILLSTLSFFFCNPIEYDMVYSNGDGESHIEVSPTQYSIMAAKRNNMLGYLFSGDICLDNLFDFIDTLKTNDPNIMLGGMIDIYISNYVRAEYLDDISKLLLYSSILEKMSNVKRGEETYDVIDGYLCNNHICIEKINDNIEKMNLKNNEGKIIHNYVELRNFFVHHLGSKEAERFLNESDLLFYLKLTITILVFKKIGITDVTFDKNFHNISVFDDSIDEFNHFLMVDTNPAYMNIT